MDSRQYHAEVIALDTRMIRARTDASISVADVLRMERERLDLVDRWFSDAPPPGGEHDTNYGKQKIEAMFTATVALVERRNRDKNSISAEDIGMRLDALEAAIRQTQSVAQERLHPGEARMFFGFAKELQFIRTVRKAVKGGCYFATAVYGSYDAEPVQTLRRFRDRRLMTSSGGRALVRFYYAVGPTAARQFGPGTRSSRIARFVLDRVAARLAQAEDRTRGRRSVAPTRK